MLAVVLLVGVQTAAVAGYDEGLSAYSAKDYVKALKEWEPLAKQHNLDALYGLCVMNANGFGVAKNRMRAIDLCQRPAENGNVDAQVLLGGLFVLIEPANDVESRKWLLKAAVQGNSTAQVSLALRYYQGDGFRKDVALAYMFTNLAAQNGSKQAMDFKAELESELLNEQVAEGRALANGWRPGTPFPAASRTGKQIAKLNKKSGS